MKAASDLRLDLVTARDMLRRAKDEYTGVTASESLRLIQAVGGAKAYGGNETERELRLQSELLSCPSWLLSRDELRACEADVEQLEAELANAEEATREWQWGIRRRMADALQAAGADTSDGLSAAAMEPAIDAALTHAGAVRWATDGLAQSDDLPF